MDTRLAMDLIVAASCIGYALFIVWLNLYAPRADGTRHNSNPRKE